jgi:hypothetical protein
MHGSMNINVESMFSVLKNKYFLKNILNMGNKSPNHIKVITECVISELVEILPVCNTFCYVM